MTFRSIFSLACCAAALLSPASAAPRPGDAKLRDDLDVAYNTWRLHLLRGNYDGWRATTSAYRQVKVRNLAVSEKRPFPASLFRQPMAPPALAPLMYVGSVVNGPTAAATYYGKVDLGLGQEPTDSNALVLLFTHETANGNMTRRAFQPHPPARRQRTPQTRRRLRADGAGRVPAPWENSRRAACLPAAQIHRKNSGGLPRPHRPGERQQYFPA